MLINTMIDHNRREYAAVRTPTSSSTSSRSWASRRPHSVDVLEMTRNSTISASDYWSSEEKYAQQVRQSAAATPRVAREEDISRDVKESALWSYIQPRGGRNNQVGVPPRGRNGEVKENLTSPRGLSGGVMKELQELTSPCGRSRQGLTPPRGLNGEVLKEMVTPPRGLNGGVMKELQELISPCGRNGQVGGWSSSQENLQMAPQPQEEPRGRVRQELASPHGRNGQVGRNGQWFSSQENLLMSPQPQEEPRGRVRQELTPPHGRNGQVGRNGQWSSSQENLLNVQQQQQLQAEEEEGLEQQQFNRSLSARLPRGAKSPVRSPVSDCMDNKRFEQVHFNCPIIDD